MTAHRTNLAAAPADQLVLELPGIPALALVGVPRTRRTPSTRGGRDTPPLEQPPAAVGESVVGERVWLVWEDDDVLGVYGDPATAAADCGALRRHAYRNSLGIHYESMAVPVFSGRRHQPTPGVRRPGL